MVTGYSQLIIEAPFTLLKGFVAGFIFSSYPDSLYFFSLRSGIVRHDRLTGVLKELLEMENVVHLCMENAVLDDFYKAIEAAKNRLGIQIREVKKIESSSFKFSFNISNEDYAAKCKKIFNNIPESVVLENYVPIEKIKKNAVGISYKTQSHPYVYKGEGNAKGEFKDIVNLYLNCKRSKCRDFIECRDIKLVLEEVEQEESE